MASSFGLSNPADLASNMQVRMCLYSSTSVYNLFIVWCNSLMVHCHS